MCSAKAAAWRQIKGGQVRAVTQEDGMPVDSLNALFESKDGSIWFGASGGLMQYRNGKVAIYTAGGRLSKYYISAISEDDEGLIVTTSEMMAFRFKDDVVMPLTFHGQSTPLSNSGNYTFVILRDQSGTQWFGTVQGLFKFDQSGPVGKARQMNVNFPVTSIFDDGRGSLWLGGRTPGLVQFRKQDGHITRYGKKDGLFDDYPTKVLADDKGDLWISTTGGIYMVPLTDLDAISSGRIDRIHAQHYGTSDGMKTAEAAPAAVQPAGVRTTDGRLWFATKKGVVVVDPKKLAENSAAPPVVVEDPRG